MSSAKRSAEEQISRDSADFDDEPTEAGTWERAPPEVLATRKIVKVGGLKGCQSSGTPHGSVTANPFASISLLPSVDAEAKPRLHIDTSSNQFVASTENNGKTTEPSQGFLAYANVNPFKAALAASSTFPSSKSPGTKSHNPFSSTSPNVNPFMSFVEKKEEFWNTMSKSSEVKPIKEVKSVNEADDAENDDDAEGEEDDGKGMLEEVKPAVTYNIQSGGPVVTGEEEEDCVLEVRVKLFRLDAKEWTDLGTGPLRVLRPKKAGDGVEVVGGRVVMRRESQPGGHGTKLLVNVSLKDHVEVARHGDKAVRLSYISVEGGADDADAKAAATTFSFKTKLVQVSCRSQNPFGVV